jgi:hypothetical protein
MKQPGDRTILNVEENNGKEDLTKIHNENMFSSRDLSCATHQPLLES